MTRASLLSDVAAARLALGTSMALPLSLLLMLALTSLHLVVVVAALVLVAAIFAVTESLRRRLAPTPPGGFAVSATRPFVEGYAGHLRISGAVWLRCVRAEWGAVVLIFASTFLWSALFRT